MEVKSSTVFISIAPLISLASLLVMLLLIFIATGRFDIISQTEGFIFLMGVIISIGIIILILELEEIKNGKTIHKKERK